MDGKDTGKIILYALSTCIWCKKIKDFLSSKNIAFDYIYVDLLKGEERAQAINDVKRYAILDPNDPIDSLIALQTGQSRK